MYLDLSSRKILKISRPKLTGTGKHFGVHLPDGRVVHLTAERHIEFITPEEFACNRDVFIESVVPGDQYHSAMERLQFALINPRPYHLSDWNCETFANWVTEGNAESSQVTGIAVLAVLATVVTIAT